MGMECADDLFRADAEAQGMTPSEYALKYGIHLPGTTSERRSRNVTHLRSIEVTGCLTMYGRSRGRPKKTRVPTAVNRSGLDAGMSSTARTATSSASTPMTSRKASE